MAPLRLRIDGRTFRDADNREVVLHGINVAGDAKFPRYPDQSSFEPDGFFDGDNVSFVGRPFSVEDAHTHFSRLKTWGYNAIRYVFTWEAIEAKGPGKYDEEWIQHTISILRIAKEYDFYVFMDPHQDVWSRFSGGSGAPMWTLYACGLDPKKFRKTEAALVQNTYPDPDSFPKMIWATNYTRMACQVLFTLFFAGRDFAPKAIIDGKNIQDWLQDHFMGAIDHLAMRIQEAGDIDNSVVIGWESLNEPNRGLIGWPDLTIIPDEQKLQKGTSPTAWQAILTGSGRPCEIPTWDFGQLGPYKSGSELVDPEGESAWLKDNSYDSRHGWKRDPDWKLGECLWAQHGIWDPVSDTLLIKDYFSKHPSTGEKVDYEYFTNNWFMEYYRKHKETVRKWFPDTIMFCQPPVLEIPPSIKGTMDDDPKMVFAPHFYDGITLMTKKWNRIWNVDVFGVLRGRYLTPALAIKIGETAIRNCFRDQLAAIQKEGHDYMGEHPCVFTEIGIPYDMDEKYAYKTGDYTSQIAAMDANHFALEGSKANGFTVWVYVATNTHDRGDQWNGEDLSIFSNEDSPLPLASRNQSRSSFDITSPAYSRGNTTENTSISPDTLKTAMKPEGAMSQAREAPRRIGDALSKPGFRAAEAFVRPAPYAVHGTVIDYAFNLREASFTLSLAAQCSTNEDAPTIIFLPEYHYPAQGSSVEVSGGKWKISTENGGGKDGSASLQMLRWWHAEGEQKITIRGVKRTSGSDGSTEEGYVEQCQQNTCLVM